MKIVYMGTPDFAVGPLKALLADGHQIAAVLTRADKPKGRGYELSFTPVKEEALKHGIPVLQPLKMKDPSLWETLRSFGADVFVVAAYGKILPPEILDIPPLGCLNIHASLLPAYRGAAPIQWAVIDGQKESGITIMKMDEGLDTGDILKQYRISLSADETGGSLFDRLAALGAEAITDTLKELADGKLTPVKQGEPATGYAKMLTREMGNIDWTRDAVSIERLVRGLDPWPGTFTYLNGKLLKIRKAALPAPDCGENGTQEKKPSCGNAAADGSGDAGITGTAALQAPGTVLRAEGALLSVSTGSGILEIRELQPEGKKRMDTAAFLRGYHIKAGDRFENH